MNADIITERKVTTDTRCKRTLVREVICVAVLVLIALAFCFTISVDAKAQTVTVGIPVEEHPELFIPRSMPTHGTGKIAVFLIQFPDYENDNPVATADYYDRLYFNGGVNTNWGDMSVADFYKIQSYGKLELKGKVFDWYTARHERSYYDNNKVELILEAADFYSKQGVDFSEFDGDGDGIMDAVVFHFAGDYSTTMGDPWYHGVTYSAGWPEGFGTIGGLCVRSFVQINEGATGEWDRSIDVICHELMHTLGMPDLYGMTFFNMTPANDLMVDNIDFINPYLKMMLGWIEEVEVITEDTEDIRLDVYGKTQPGKIAIVTNDWDGLFGEFYLIAYRKYCQYTTAAIWHIDARLSSDGKSFLWGNANYDPRPDKENPHRTGTPSAYMFIEEISADPDCNFVFKPPVSLDQSGFGKDSVLGPDTIPSSDTHDGNFTGIRISNFISHNDTYLTFDVAFVTDENAPSVTTKEDDLEFTDTVTISFSEHVYAGESFDSISVTDADGNALNAKIILPHYPKNEMEIKFQDDAHKSGYILNLPEGCLKDSSGNLIKATRLTASKDIYIFPTGEEQLPGTGEFARSNSGAHFFRYENELVVITHLWENIVSDAKLEIMRLSLDGKVLSQKITDNPFEGSYIASVHDVGDGCYIALCCAKGSQNDNLLFCFDTEGNIKWKNDSYNGTSMHLLWFTSFLRESELAVHVNGGGMAYIDVSSGKVRTAGPIDILGAHPLDLSNGKIICQHTANRDDGTKFTVLYLVNTETYEVEAWSRLDGFFTEFNVACANSNGTYLLYGDQDANIVVCLLDCNLNLVKTVNLGKSDSTPGELYCFEDGGFCFVKRTTQWNHDNAQYRIRRYDQYLNLVWKSDAFVNFIYFFKSESGELMAYKSMSEPQRECYIEHYGKETITTIMAGDVNGDGTITIKDLVTFAQYLAKWDVKVNEPALDVNCDGAVNIKDIVKLAQYLAGWDVSIGVPEEKTEKKPEENASKGLQFALNDDKLSFTVSGIGTCTDKDIVIPSTYNGLPVTGISWNAFENCKSLTSVTISSGVTSINYGAFNGCTSLTSVTMPDGVTSIGGHAFNGCTSLTSVTIPDGVTSIDYGAFDGCTSLTSVTIPDGVTSIGGHAFV